MLIIFVNAPPPPNMGEEEDQADIHDVIQRMNDLELQVGVIDANVGELTSLAHGMRQDIAMINHNLLAYFQAQNFALPPYPSHDPGHNN